jgi:O-antigen ligase
MIIVVIFSGKKYFRFTTQSATILVFWLTLGISVLFAWNQEIAWESFNEYRNLVIFYFILHFVIRTAYDLVFMIISYVATMALYLMKAEWEFFMHGQNRYDMGVIRMIGIENTFGGPNDVAMSVVVSMPFLIFLWLNRRAISQLWPKFWQKWFGKIIVICAILSFSAVILTNSRSGMAGTILFVALSAFRGKGFFKKLGYILLGVALLVMIWQFVPEENKNRFRTIWDSDAGPQSATASAEGRIEGFYAGLEMFKRFPLTGVGIGNFIEYRYNYVDGVGLRSHNLIGQLLGETGLLGAIAFIIMIGTIFINTYIANKLARDNWQESFKIFVNINTAIRISIILLFFLGMFGHNLFRFNWLWLAAFADHSKLLMKNKLDTSI